MASSSWRSNPSRSRRFADVQSSPLEAGTSTARADLDEVAAVSEILRSPRRTTENGKQLPLAAREPCESWRTLCPCRRVVALSEAVGGPWRAVSFRKLNRPRPQARRRTGLEFGSRVLRHHRRKFPSSRVRHSDAGRAIPRIGSKCVDGGTSGTYVVFPLRTRNRYWSEEGFCHRIR